DGGTYYAIVDGGYLGLADSACHALGDGSDSCVFDPTPGDANKDDDQTKIARQRLTLNASQASGRAHSLVLKGNLPAGDAGEVDGVHTVPAGTSSGFRGLAVTATNSDDLAGVGISAAFAGGAAVAVAGSVDLVSVTTSASIGSSVKINPTNTGANGNQSVL